MSLDDVVSRETRLLQTVWRVVESFAAALDRESVARQELAQRHTVLEARIAALEAVGRPVQPPATTLHAVPAKVNGTAILRPCEQCGKPLPEGSRRNRRFCYSCVVRRSQDRVNQAHAARKEGYVA